MSYDSLLAWTNRFLKELGYSGKEIDKIPCSLNYEDKFRTYNIKLYQALPNNSWPHKAVKTIEEYVYSKSLTHYKEKIRELSKKLKDNNLLAAYIQQLYSDRSKYRKTYELPSQLYILECNVCHHFSLSDQKLEERIWLLSEEGLTHGIYTFVSYIADDFESMTTLLELYGTKVFHKEELRKPYRLEYTDYIPFKIKKGGKK